LELRLKNRIMNPLNLLSLPLFLLECGAVEIFGVRSCRLIPDWEGNLAWWGGTIFAAFLLLLTIEIFLVSRLDSRDKGPFLTPLMLTHLPWFLGFTLPWITSMTFPAPHDFTLRKIQILFGTMWMSHLFLFAIWLLWRTRDNGKKISINFAWIAPFFLVGGVLWTSQCELSGDEPHYLLMAYSLVHDGDLDLANNYQNRDYERFYHRGELSPQGLDHKVGDKLYSYHPLGPALLILPGFAVLGRLGTSVTIACLGAWTLFLLLRVLEYRGAGGLPLVAIGAVGLFSGPLFLFSGLVYPEIPTACLVALVLLFFLEGLWGWVGVVCGGLLWMHNRNALLVIPLLSFVLVSIWKKEGRDWGKIFRLGTGFLLPLSGLAFYFRILYGVWTPLGAHHEAFTSLFGIFRFPVGFFGLILDQECGLWVHFPVFALAGAGGILLWKSGDPLDKTIVGTFVFYYLFMSFYENLGLTPAARYMAGVSPLLLAMLYPVFERLKEGDPWRTLALLLGVLGAVINWVLSAVPWMRYNKLEGENWMLKMTGDALHFPLTLLEPSFHSRVIEPRTYLLSLLGVAVVGGLTAWFLKVKAKPHPTPRR